jgi:spore germination cell wall hydrolase CwlJ-like protein
VQYRLAKRAEFVHTSFTICRRLPPSSPGQAKPAVTASKSRGDRGVNVGGQFALVVQDTLVLTSGTQANGASRGLLSAALMGSGFGLALGAIYLTGGMAQAISDHHRAVRIAEAAGGGLSETMLQREMDRLDPAALKLARTHDQFAADDPREAFQGWPQAMGDRQALGHRGSPLESARQLDCLTQAVYFEAPGETARGQAAVAQVVMNRVANRSFPKTVCGVVFQGAASHGCQFSFACDGSMRHGLEADAWDRARQVAERALSGRVLADIGGATHFHTTSVRPDWGPQMLRVAQVGLHVFYRLNPHAPLNPVADHAVFVSLPAPAPRIAPPVLEKASAVTVTAPTGQAADTSAKAASKIIETPKAVETTASQPAEAAAS